MNERLLKLTGDPIKVLNVFLYFPNYLYIKIMLNLAWENLSKIWNKDRKWDSHNILLTNIFWKLYHNQWVN